MQDNENKLFDIEKEIFIITKKFSQHMDYTIFSPHFRKLYKYERGNKKIKGPGTKPKTFYFYVALVTWKATKLTAYRGTFRNQGEAA